MKRKRVERGPIEAGVGPVGANSAAVVLPVWTPVIRGSRFDLTLLKGHALGQECVQCLIEWQSEKRGGLGVARSVRSFLAFVLAARLTVGASALAAYRNGLEADAGKGGSTRLQLFSSARAFVQELMRRNVIPMEEVPAGFAGVPHVPKATFSGRAKEWERLRDRSDYKAHKAEAEQRNLDDMSKDAYAASRVWMATIEREAWVDVSRRMVDWDFARSIVEKSPLVDFRDGWSRVRSVSNAIGMLYQTFGRVLPSSTEWPDGVVDFCKLRGWPPDRLKASLFMTAKSLDAFLVLALANELLLPNVDSVLRYAFVGCMTVAEEGDVIRVHFGKFRGSNIEADLERSSPLVKALSALESQVRAWHAEIGTWPRGLDKDGGIPLFLHFPPGKRTRVVRGIGSDSACDMVRRFVRAAARREPALEPLVDSVTGENFRPTHMLIRRLSGQSIFQIQAAAHHVHTSTTQAYMEHVEVDATGRRRMVDYQRFLVTSATANRFRRLGNGFLCEEQEAPEESCCRLDACGAGEKGCPARRIVLESVPVVAEWIAISRQIREQEASLKVHFPERWAAVWGPRLIEYEVLLEQVSSKARLAAEALAPSIPLLPLE